MKIGYDFVLTFSITWAFSKIGLYFEHGHMIITWLFDKRIIDSDFEFGGISFWNFYVVIFSFRLWVKIRWVSSHDYHLEIIWRFDYGIID